MNIHDERMFKINEVKLMIYNETGTVRIRDYCNNTEVIKLKYNNFIFNKPIKEIDV